MSGSDAFSDEMCGFLLLPRRPGRELDEPLPDMLLTGQPFPLAAPEQLHAVAGMLASLVGPAGPGEEARTAFARTAAPAGVSRVAGRPARRRLPWLPARVSAGLAAAAAGRPSAASASRPSASAKAHAKAKAHFKGSAHPKGKPRSQPGGRALAIGAPEIARAWSL